MFNIRTATPADADHIMKIAHQTYWATYRDILSTEQITYMLGAIYVSDTVGEQIADNTQTYLILEEEDGQPVAFAAYAPRTDDASIYKLHKLYCLPQTQGKGYGQALIKAVEQATLDAGSHTLDLNVNRHNKAKNFYEKMGFSIVYDEDVPIGPYFMNDHVMRKEL